MKTPQEYLKYYFGHEDFRTGQQQIVASILNGRDALCVMPTGAGKSVCYQIPALMLPGVTLVISPLISLMKDQVNALTQSGVPAAYINSSLSAGQYRKAIALAGQGRYKIIYVAPERLTAEDFLQEMAGVSISLLAVDEAHCVSQWGQDFRPSYLQIMEFVRRLPVRPVVAAFTATATREVKEDIAAILELDNPLTVTTGFDRPNLYFGVITPKDKNAELLAFMEKHAAQSGVIYCSTRKAVEEVCELLRSHGYAATRYHAGLSDAERHQNQNDFVCDAAPVIVATNAFGMGIDKSNVSFVVHYNMPKNIESYYQEAGRAGRDGTAADCVLMYSPRDVRTCQFLIEQSEPNPEIDPKTQEQLRIKERERLKYMTFYCTTTDCLRGFILKYFGEQAESFCGNCSSCETGYEEVDITVEAQKILSCVAKTGQRYGMQMMIDVLRGAKGERLLSLRLDQQSTYGVMAQVPIREVRCMIQALLHTGYLHLTDSEYPVLHLTNRSDDVLRQGETVWMKMPIVKPKAERPEKSGKKRADKTAYAAQPDLYAALKKLRSELAAQAGIPAYIVFTDAALQDMCRKLPCTTAEFLEVSGVGQTKLERYGVRFLEVIAPFAMGNK